MENALNLMSVVAILVMLPKMQKNLIDALQFVINHVLIPYVKLQIHVFVMKVMQNLLKMTQSVNPTAVRPVSIVNALHQMSAHVIKAIRRAIIFMCVSRLVLVAVSMESA
jgi:hypothetical protein